MDQRLTRRIIAAILLAALLGLGLLLLGQRRERKETIQESFGLVRVLSSTFAPHNALKVGEVAGKLDVTTVDPGAIRFLRSAQTVTLPFSIDYTIDLSQLTPADYRWNRDRRTLTVRAPDVVAGKPNIEESLRTTVATDGIFISRRAYDNLGRRAAVLANSAARKQAADPRHLAKAQANARKAIADLLRAPLGAAGLGDVEVIVRLPQDGVRDSERWDVGPSIADVLAARER